MEIVWTNSHDIKNWFKITTYYVNIQMQISDQFLALQYKWEIFTSECRGY